MHALLPFLDNRSRQEPLRMASGNCCPELTGGDSDCRDQGPSVVIADGQSPMCVAGLPGC